MYVLVATTEHQGDRPDDFCHAVEGELVMLPILECANPKCGCQRSFAGISSHRATTTAKVIDRPDLDYDAYRELLLDDATASYPGWDPRADPEWLDDLDDFLGEAHSIAEVVGVGAVIARSRRSDGWEIRAQGEGGWAKRMRAQF